MNRLNIEPPATVHLIGICGTGMGALAGLLNARGYRVTGSDAHPYPPMSTELANLGITVMQGYRAANLDHRPDLVVVGNICRADHPEAKAARDRGLLYASLPRTLCDLFLHGRRPLVVSGTHGKTTTAALTAYLLHRTGRDPSFFIGGATADFGMGFRLGQGPWFVLEGDEYDSAYFEQVPKFVSYAPSAAVITSVEHDHLDIYPTFDAYRSAFSDLVALVPKGGLLAVFAGDREAVNLAQRDGIEVVRYAVSGDPAADADWLASPGTDGRFDLAIGGKPAGAFKTPLAGRHNLGNALAAMILCHRACGVPLSDLAGALPAFKGVVRRQEVLGTPNRITVYSDFAHHPTAVGKTLEALRARHEDGRLLAAFEPRSATACRRLHQKRYAEAFDSADRAVIAPVGRDLPETERLDTRRLAEDISARGIPAVAAQTLDQVVEEIGNWARPGDTLVLLSNGGFGGVPARVLELLK